MKQILHIFRKDTRRFWLEILLSVVITLSFALVFPNFWRVFRDSAERQRMVMLTDVLGILTMAGWWLLVARVVHAETLVGDQQFWITRPYKWRDLLAAKALFLAVWIGVPYLITQCVILAEAGFHPLPWFPRLLLNLLVAGTIFLLPVFSIAAVTSTFARMTLTLLGSSVLLTGYSLALAAPHDYTSSNPYTNHLLFPLLAVGCALAIVLQYATRRTWVSRGLLLLLPVLLAITVSAYRRQSLVDRAYPQPGTGAAAPISFAHVPNNHVPDEARTWEGKDFIDLPMRYSGVADGYAVLMSDFRFTLTAPDGQQWKSPWQVMGERVGPDGEYARLSLQISPDQYARFKTTPVTLGIEFAVSRYQSDNVTQATFPEGNDRDLRGFGICSHDYSFGGIGMLLCRSALNAPPLTHATAVFTTARCSEPATPQDATARGDSWYWSTDPRQSGEALDFGLVPVWTPRLWFRVNDDDQEHHGHAHWSICPESPLTLTQYHLVDRTRVDFTLTNFALPAKVVPTS